MNATFEPFALKHKGKGKFEFVVTEQEAGAVSDGVIETLMIAESMEHLGAFISDAGIFQQTSLTPEQVGAVGHVMALMGMLIKANSIGSLSESLGGIKNDMKADEVTQ